MAEVEAAPEESTLVDALAELRHAPTDAARSEAVAKQRARGAWTARERIEELIDPGSFREYGLLAKPSQAELMGPADGIVTGLARVRDRPVAVASYDYTVMAGSQGNVNNIKLSRMLQIADERSLPVVIFAEGAGHRVQEATMHSRGGGEATFPTLARLSGRVPTVCGVPGRAFAGHAVLAGLCDFVVATQYAAIGMAGPPLVEAALGERLTPEEIGAASIHATSGAADAVARDEAELVSLISAYLSYFEGRFEPSDPVMPATALRSIVPADPRKPYDVREVISGLCDLGELLELRAGFARSLVTALGRVDGWPVGFVASQPLVLAGAIDAAASDKISRFVKLCDAFGLPVVFLVDSPGFLVGPSAERSALMRHSTRVIHTLTHTQVPFFTATLRKSYGLAHFAMGGRPLGASMVVAWPTAEYGAMGPEGAAKVIGGNAGIDAEREHSKSLRREGASLKMAEIFAIDDMIDPAETRATLADWLAAVMPATKPSHRPIEPW
ncbi:carboxyl transferase domain-containing protein [Dactylosporangium sp. AC04546]|uniref:acyl-CoA carboxylase subunit beta n=1 Tax=Dactylosporangium sp. AC04546 TaxID=2862460 RepID=UPI001EDD3669|nr:carboxyl transferase domain-containing protein [Dactylosporangium sp. AC04546]WVK86946.1 carboxyl transferase domain-containing protein [Dactylosporangium sp. AC04546]